MSYKIQKQPFVVPTTDGKLIEEHFGLVATQSKDLSLAHMIAPPGWSEPFQNQVFLNTPISLVARNNLLLMMKSLF